jgi:hypothetical protein
MSSLGARLLLLFATAAVAASTLIGLFPARVPQKTDPGYVDVIFESRLVVLAARLVVVAAAFVLLLGAAYVTASMIVRISRGQWLRRAGPFEAELSGAERSLTHVSSLLEELARASRRNEDLERRLRVRDDDLNAKAKEVEELAAEVADLRGRYS